MSKNSLADIATDNLITALKYGLITISQFLECLPTNAPPVISKVVRS